MICAACGQDKKIHARGLCNACYVRACKAGRLGSVKPAGPPDLPGEKWADIPGHLGWQISIEGRVKSTRGPGPKILAPHVRRGVWCIKDAKGGGFIIHTKVVEIFCPGEKGKIIFRDGNRLNPALSNLVVDTKEQRIARAVQMAEQSTSPWAADLAAYWRGDPHALDCFFTNMKRYLMRCVALKLSKWQKSGSMDIESIAHATLVEMFFSISNASFVHLDNVKSYILTIADRIMMRYWRYAGPLVPIEDQYGDCGDVTNIDVAGYVHPSAEMVAMYREAVCTRADNR